MKDFLKYYNGFFLWAGINEQQFINDVNPNIEGKNIVSAEWADEYPDLDKLIISVEKILIKKKYDLSFLDSLAICFLIDQEGENIADLTFNHLNIDEIVFLCKFSIENQIFDIQRQLITRLYENNLDCQYIDYLYNNTKYDYIKNYVNNYVRPRSAKPSSPKSE